MSKMSSSHVIDLDKYVFKNDSMSFNRLDAQTVYLDEYPSLDSEIIDYGICEEQDEDCKEMSRTTQETLKTESSKENALKGASSKAVDVHSCCTKPAMVKVVDCDKYPWYYTKYKDQILKRKYRNALDHARNIMKYLQETLNEEGDDSISSLYQKSAITKKIMTLTEELKRSESNSSSMDNRTLSQKSVQVGEKYSGASKVDIKKNTGLIGLKVQRSSTEKLKEKNAVKKKVCEEKLQKRNKMLSSISNRKVQNVHDGVQTVSHIIKEKEIDRNKKTKHSHDILSQKNETKTRKSDYSDIHKVKDSTNKTTHLDAIEDHSDLKKTMRYKPMPKSKKIALEKRRTMENKNVLTTPKQEVKYQLSTQHEHLSILKKNTIIPTYSRKENAEPIKKSFDKLNKFTGKVMKILSCPKTKNDSIHYNKKIKSNDLNSFNYQKFKNDFTKKNINASKYMLTVRSNLSDTTVISTGPTADSLNMQPVYVDTKILKPYKNNGYEKKLSHRSLFGTLLPSEVIDGNEKYDARICIPSTNHKDIVKDYAICSSQRSSSHDNQQKQTVLSKRKPVYGKQIINIEDDIKTKPMSNPSGKPIAQEPLDPAEYIVPDVIHPLQTPYESNIHTKIDINKAAHDLTAPLPAPLQSISVADKSSTGQKTPLITTNIQIPDITRPLAKTSMQPHILKCALQAPPTSQQQTPIVSAVLSSHNLSSPRHTAPSLVNIRPITPHQYQAPRKQNQTPNYQLNTHNVQAMPAYQQTTVNYNSNQKNCGQLPFGTLNYINMPCYNVQAPVQTYNIIPAYGYYGIDFFNPAQPSQNLPPPNYINNNTSNCSIIGKNHTGFVKKINIPILGSTDGERQINRNDGIYGKNNVTLNTTSIDVVQNVEIGNKTIAKFLSDTPVLSDSTLPKEKINVAVANAKRAESKEIPSESSKLLLDQPNQRKQLLTNNNLEAHYSLSQDTTVKNINKFKLQKEALGSSKTKLNKNIEKIQENITNTTILDTNKIQNEQLLHKGVKGYSQKDTTSNITEIELASIPLPDILPQKSIVQSETKTLNTLKRPPTSDSKVENKNIFRNNRPGPLSKKIKLHNFAEGVKTPPQEFQKIPACKGYSPPILPIPTYEILLSEAKEKYASYASKEKPSVQYEKGITPVILENNLKKSTKQPESPKVDTTKKISLEEYKNRNLKEQKRKKPKENETNK